MPKYTELRGRVYWFKRRAPKPLQPHTAVQLENRVVTVGKNGYIKFSLLTTNRGEAATLARKFAYLVDEATKAVGSRASQSGATVSANTALWNPTLVEASELSPSEIQRSADAMYASLLAADERTYADGVRRLLTGGSSAEDGDDVREPDRYRWSSADLPPPSLKGQAQLLQELMPTLNLFLAQVTQKVAAAPSHELLPFADAFRRFIDAMEKRRESISVPTPAPHKPAETSFTLSLLYEKFKAYKVATKAWKKPAVQDSREYGPIVREFIEVVGDKDVRTLTMRDGETYFEHTMARGDIGLGTKKRNFARIKALLNYGRKKHSVSDITGPLEIDSSYAKTHNSYERFTVDDLKALFHSTAYRQKGFAKASQFWLPILGLYTGARIDELASLRVDVVCQIDGVWSYFLSSAKANQGGKNQYAPRWVPIHPEVLKAGFLDHWRTVQAEGHTRVFPELGAAERDGPGKRATVDFTEYRRTVGVGAQSGRSAKVFHSFRSTLISELIERGTPSDIRHKLLGHSVGDKDSEAKGVHSRIYDQSQFQARAALNELSKANFGLSHTAFEDTPAMVAARQRHLHKQAQVTDET